jgi:hypothetical protein
LKSKNQFESLFDFNDETNAIKEKTIYIANEFKHSNQITTSAIQNFENTVLAVQSLLSQTTELNEKNVEKNQTDHDNENYKNTINIEKSNDNVANNNNPSSSSTSKKTRSSSRINGVQSNVLHKLNSHLDN